MAPLELCFAVKKIGLVPTKKPTSNLLTATEAANAEKR